MRRRAATCPEAYDGTRGGAIELGDVTYQDGVELRDDSLDGSSDSVDYYAFELTVTRKVNLGLLQQDANADLYVEDSDGTVLFRDENAGTADESISQNLSSGNYFIRVEAQETGQNDYRLSYGVEAATQEQQQPTATPTPNSAAAGKPAITGTVQTGETLTAGTSGISDGNGMTNPQFTYQWLHSVDGTDTEISGATGSTYVLTTADLAHAIKVKVSFTDDDDYSETVTSDATETLLVAQQQMGDDPDPPVCDRGSSVIREILRLTPRTSCSDVTSEDLSGIDEKMHIWSWDNLTLETGDFAGLSSAPSMEVFAGDYLTIKTGAFTGLSSLEYLFIQGADGLDLQTGAFTGMGHLEELRLYKSKLRSLEDGIFEPLTGLTKIEMDRNGFTALPTGALEDLTALETLDMRYNNIGSIPSGLFDDADTLTSLKTIPLTVNRISSIEDDAFDSATELTRLYLGDNDLAELPDDIFDKLTKLERLELRHNELSAVVKSDFDKLTKLKVLNLRYNEIRTWPDNLFDDLSELTHLDLRGNGASTMNLTAIDGLTKLKRLDLGANRISTLTADTFSPYTELTYLSLSHNRLESLPAGVFDANTKLTFLDLESNSISNPPANVFEQNVALRELLLSANQITSLPAGILDANTELRGLYLVENPIDEIPVDFFDHLTHLNSLTLPDSIARAPRLGAAELSDANTIELTYDVPLAYPGPLKNLLTAEVNGTERTITGAGRNVRRVLITLDGAALTASDTVTLDYTSVRPDRHFPSSVNADENMTQVRRSGIDPPPSITHTIAG